MGLINPTRQVSDPFGPVSEVASWFRTATVDICKDVGRGKYDEDTNTYENPDGYVTVISGASARLQQINLGTQYDGMYDPTAEVLYRVELSRDKVIQSDVDIFLDTFTDGFSSTGGIVEVGRKHVVRVIDGGNNKRLNGKVMRIISFGDSNHEQVANLYAALPLES
jgi:hypothetical protein